MRHLIAALLLVGCRTSFDIAPQAAPNLIAGHVTTRDGEVVETPDDFEAKVITTAEEAELGTFQTPGVRCRVGQLFHESQTDALEDRGVSFDDIEFDRPEAVRGEGEMLVIDTAKGCVFLPFAAVGHIEVVDQDKRTGKIVGIVLGTTIPGIALIATVIALAANLDFH